MKSPSREPIRVSDHAVLRYLERGMGLNIEMVRAHIAGVCASPAAFGAIAVRAEGLRFELANNVCVTVRPDGQGPGATSRKRTQAKMRRETEDRQGFVNGESNVDRHN
jgi:hypothetical protein